jgi:hypothetical protein
MNAIMSLLILLLSLASCKTINKEVSSLTDYTFAPSQGIVIYDKEIHKGLSAKGGKTFGRHLEAAKKHCKKYNKVAKYETSGVREFEDLGINKSKSYEKYQCI